MMHLRLNTGAIIKVTLLNGSSYAGKVDTVEDDELVLIAQQLVSGALSSYDKAAVTVDTDVAIHIDREKIVCWRYAKYSDFNISDVLTVKAEADIDPNKINHYTKDGFCKGNDKNRCTI